MELGVPQLLAAWGRAGALKEELRSMVGLGMTRGLVASRSAVSTRSLGAFSSFPSVSGVRLNFLVEPKDSRLPPASTANGL
jgi:hypothetical protein